MELTIRIDDNDFNRYEKLKREKVVTMASSVFVAGLDALGCDVSLVSEIEKDVIPAKDSVLVSESTKSVKKKSSKKSVKKPEVVLES